MVMKVTSGVKRRGTWIAIMRRRRGLLFILAALAVFGVRSTSGNEQATEWTPGTTLGFVTQTEASQKGTKKFGDKCEDSSECGFEGSFCDKDKGTCQCIPDLPVTNHLDKCGKAVLLTKPCNFSEQCHASKSDTECRNGLCLCSNDKHPHPDQNENFDCVVRGTLKIGDKCSTSAECGYDWGFCDPTQRSTCQCWRDYPVNNQITKCGKGSNVNESCFFTEQCENVVPQTECRDGRCVCLFDKTAIIENGVSKCVAIHKERDVIGPTDPTMYIILGVMILMFVILCVVLRLFSKARYRENRTIFNTPNPRLMNVSLLRDSKLLHGQERRGSRASMRAPSRQPSLASLRAPSPNGSQGSRDGSRRSSRASNASGTSAKSPRSPKKGSIANNTTTPVLENVTVDVQEPRA